MSLLPDGIGVAVSFFDFDGIGWKILRFQSDEHQPLDHVGCLAFSSDGLLLAVGGDFSGAIQIWNAENAEYLYTLEESRQRDPVKSLEFSINGRWLVSKSKNRELLVWNVDQKRVCHVVRPQLPEELLLLEDGTRLMCWMKLEGADDGRKLWTFVNWEETPERPRSSVNGIGGTPLQVYDSENKGGAHDCKKSQAIEDGTGGSLDHLLLVSVSDEDTRLLSERPGCWLIVKRDRVGGDSSSPIARSSLQPELKVKTLVFLPIDSRYTRLASCQNRCAVTCGRKGLLIFDISKIAEKYTLVPKLTADLLYDEVNVEAEVKEENSEVDTEEEEEGEEEQTTTT